MRADVGQMLGLVDRARVIDLFDAVMAGDPARALAELAQQFEAGGDPETILTDMADFVHWVTRLRLVRDSAMMDGARTETEKTRGLEFAAKLTMPTLARAWQMLLKGIQETATAPNPMQSAEMVLIRLAHAVDLPPADELARIAKSGTVERLPSKSLPLRSENTPASNPASNLAPALSPAPQVPPTTHSATQAAPTAFTDFAGLIKLVSERRDVKLKAELERFVRPISVAEGRIELALEANAPPGLSNELMRKLEAWTGRRHIITVARDGGAEPLLKQKKSAEALALQEARALPAVQAILKAFPGAEILGVREPQLPNPETTSPDPEDPDEEHR